MTITALPSLSRSSPTFKTDVDTFFGSQLPTFSTEVNTEIDRINQIAFGSYSATSTTSLTVGTGTKNLTVETGKGFTAGQAIIVANTATPANYMTGQVTSYNSATGAMVLNSTITSGSGTASAWSISVTAINNTSAIGTVYTGTATPIDGTWLVCDGSVYLQSSYAALYAGLGLLANNPNGAGVWTQRTLPASVNWSSVTYGNGVFVAVAQGSSIAATSPDGITWTQRALPVSSNWFSVTYGNGVFVAVARSSLAAATSSDGVTWTQRALPVSSNWFSVTYGNGIFVAVAQGSSDTAATSSDGVTWTQRALPVSSNWYSVTYGNGVFVAVATGSIAANTPSILTYNGSTQFAVPTLAGQVGVKQYIKAL